MTYMRRSIKHKRVKFTSRSLHHFGIVYRSSGTPQHADAFEINQSQFHFASIRDLSTIDLITDKNIPHF